MLKIEKTVLPSPEQWEIIIEGMRNPMNSWDKMDSISCDGQGCYFEDCPQWKNDICDGGMGSFVLGKADHQLMTSLAKGGAVHAKYRRMIPVFLTINAPLYWWKEFDTYKVGTVANSCSTMHKIHAKEFTLDDFSHDRMNEKTLYILETMVDYLNAVRNAFLVTQNKTYWDQMIQLLPTSYNQKRTVMLNYEVLCNIYHSRKNHKLTEWHTFCDWIEQLPYSELITGGHDNERINRKKDENAVSKV